MFISAGAHICTVITTPIVLCFGKRFWVAMDFLMFLVCPLYVCSNVSVISILTKSVIFKTKGLFTWTD